MKLTSTYVDNANYKVYADNLFTDIPLLVKLKERGLHYTGTVRKNRMTGCNLFDEKGRGSYDYRVEENNNIIAVRWFDNRAVTLVSTHTAVQPVMEAKRWDKKKERSCAVAYASNCR